VDELRAPATGLNRRTSHFVQRFRSARIMAMYGLGEAMERAVLIDSL
jgi:hypothetical protein